MKKRKVIVCSLAVILVITVGVSFYTKNITYRSFYTFYCQSNKLRLEKMFEDHSKKYASPIIGGITPEMQYQECREKYGLE